MEIALLVALIASNALWIWRVQELQKKRSKKSELLNELTLWMEDLQREVGVLKVERVDPRSIFLVPPYNG